MQTYENANRLVINANEKIEPGTSGSPVVNDSGELIGVMSIVSETPGLNSASDGSIPFLKLSLPVWVRNQIESEQ